MHSVSALRNSTFGMDKRHTFFSPRVLSVARISSLFHGKTTSTLSPIPIITELTIIKHVFRGWQGKLTLLMCENHVIILYNHLITNQLNDVFED